MPGLYDDLAEAGLYDDLATGESPEVAEPALDYAGKIADAAAQMKEGLNTSKYATRRAQLADVAAKAVDIPGAFHTLINLPNRLMGRGDMPNLFDPDQVEYARDFYGEKLAPHVPDVKLPPTVEGAMEGVGQGLDQFISGATSPDTIAAMILAKRFPMGVGRTFQGQMLGAVPESTERLIHAKTPEEAGAASVALAANALLPAAIERGMGQPPIPQVGRFMEPNEPVGRPAETLTGEDLKTPPGAAPSDAAGIREQEAAQARRKWQDYKQSRPRGRPVRPDTEALVQAEIENARKNGSSPEFRALFGGIDPEIAGTTPEKVTAYAQKLGMEWKPVPKPEADATTGAPPNASQEPSAASIPKPPFRPPVGEETPLRQSGEAAGARPEETPPQAPVSAGELLSGDKPVSQVASAITAMTHEEWDTLSKTYTGKVTGGTTGFAIDLGAAAKTAEDVAALKKLALDERAKMRSSGKLSTRAQAAREAYEAATGVNLEGEPALHSIRALFNPDYEPPVPHENALTAAQERAQPDITAPKPRTAETLLKNEPGATPFGHIAEMSNEEANKFFEGNTKRGNAAQRDAVMAGMKLGAAEVPKLEALRDKFGAEMQTAAAAGDDAGMSAAFGKNVWFSGAIEGAARKGPNYERLVKESAPKAAPESNEGQAAAIGITTPKEFAALAEKVKRAEKITSSRTRDPVTGKTFTSIELMDQLEREGKPRMGPEFSRRRGYTAAEIKDHQALGVEIEKQIKAGVDDADILHFLGTLSVKESAPKAEPVKPAPINPGAPEPIVAEGMTLSKIKRRLPVGYEQESVRIENGRIVAKQKPAYGGQWNYVSLKKASVYPYAPAAPKGPAQQVTIKAKTASGRDINVTMEAKEAEAMFTKRKSAFEMLRDCLNGK